MRPRYASTTTQATYSAEYHSQEFVHEDEFPAIPTEGVRFRKKLATVMNVMTVGTWVLGLLLYFI